jgi:hypothetical protein
VLRPQNKGATVNRREFCLSMGLLLTGSVAAGIPERFGTTTTTTTTTKTCFRAKKIFLQHWNDNIGGETVFRQTKLLRQKLIQLRKEYSSIIVFPDHRVALPFLNRFRCEADKAGLALFLPAPNNDAISKSMNHVRFLEVSAEEIVETETVESETMESAKLKTGGVLCFLSEEQRLILFDSSRCLWTVFVCRNNNATISAAASASSSAADTNLSRLATAHVLDRLLKNESGGFL